MEIQGQKLRKFLEIHDKIYWKSRAVKPEKKYLTLCRATNPRAVFCNKITSEIILVRRFSSKANTQSEKKKKIKLLKIISKIQSRK